MWLWQPRLINIVISRLVVSESPDSQALDRSRSTFFRSDEIEVANRSRFFRFGEIGNRIPCCIWRLRFTLDYFTFLHFISIFIFLGRSKPTEVKLLDRPAFGDAKIFLSDRKF